MLDFYLKGQTLDALEFLALELIAKQASTVIYQARQQAAIQNILARKEEELTHLRRAGLLISSRPRLDEMLEAILQIALELTDARYGIFRLMDQNGQRLVTRAIAGDHLDGPLIESLPLDSNSIMGWVARQRQPILIRDLQTEPWVNRYYPLDAKLIMRSEQAVPLIGASGRLKGVLNLESTQVNGFSAADSHLLQALATQAVIAIQEARLLDAVQEAAQLLLTQPFQVVMNRLAALACGLLDAAASVIWTREGPNLVLISASAPAGDVGPRDERIPIEGSLAGQAIQSRKPVIAKDVRTDSRFYRPDLAVKYGWVQALIVPLMSSEEGEPVGAFSVYRAETPDESVFDKSDWDEKVLSSLAHYAALAVQNAARQETLRQVQERNAVAETFAAIGDIAANLLHNLNNKVGIIPVRIQGIQDKCQAAIEADPYLAKSLAEIERSAAQAMEIVTNQCLETRCFGNSSVARGVNPR